MRTHVTVLGVIFLVLSVVEAAAGLAIVLAFLGIGIFASILAQLPFVGIFVSGMGLFLGIVLLAFALPEFLTGWGLLNERGWGRILGIVMCCFSLVKFPHGTLLGAYGLWVLLHTETNALFRRSGLA